MHKSCAIPSTHCYLQGARDDVQPCPGACELDDAVVNGRTLRAARNPCSRGPCWLENGHEGICQPGDSSRTTNSGREPRSSGLSDRLFDGVIEKYGDSFKLRKNPDEKIVFPVVVVDGSKKTPHEALFSALRPWFGADFLDEVVEAGLSALAEVGALAQSSAVPKPLACPYCGASLIITLETLGSAYSPYDRPESIECDAASGAHCAATWEPDGTPRNAPEWVRHPGLYPAPHSSEPPGSIPEEAKR